jgi:hypothetical protein
LAAPELPAVPPGKIQRVAQWTTTITTSNQVLPFRLQPGDLLVLSPSHLSGVPGSNLQFKYLPLTNQYGSTPPEGNHTIAAGGIPQIWQASPYSRTPDTDHEVRCTTGTSRLTIIVYRGMATSDPIPGFTVTSMAWSGTPLVLQGTRPVTSYASAPDTVAVEYVWAAVIPSLTNGTAEGNNTTKLTYTIGPMKIDAPGTLLDSHEVLTTDYGAADYPAASQRMSTHLYERRAAPVMPAVRAYANPCSWTSGDSTYHYNWGAEAQVARAILQTSIKAPAELPAVPYGEIQRVATWEINIVSNGIVRFPFRLKRDDVILIVGQQLDDTGDGRLNWRDFATLPDHYPQYVVCNNPTHVWKVGTVHATNYPGLQTNSYAHVFVAVYRGVAPWDTVDPFEVASSDFQWSGTPFIPQGTVPVTAYPAATATLILEHSRCSFRKSSTGGGYVYSIGAINIDVPANTTRLWTREYPNVPHGEGIVDPLTSVVDIWERRSTASPVPALRHYFSPSTWTSGNPADVHAWKNFTGAYRNVISTTYNSKAAYPALKALVSRGSVTTLRVPIKIPLRVIKAYGSAVKLREPVKPPMQVLSALGHVLSFREPVKVSMGVLVSHANSWPLQVALPERVLSPLRAYHHVSPLRYSGATTIDLRAVSSTSAPVRPRIPFQPALNVTSTLVHVPPLKAGADVRALSAVAGHEIAGGVQLGPKFIQLSPVTTMGQIPGVVMAGYYPDAPDFKVWYNDDGSVPFTQPTTGGTVVPIPPTPNAGMINGEGTSNASVAVSTTSRVGVVFPQLVDVKGLFFLHNGSTSDASGVVRTSSDTTSGADGVWSTRTSTFPSKGQGDAGGTVAWRSAVQVVDYTSIRGLTFSANTGGQCRQFHIYGRPTAGENPDRLRFWDPTLDQEIGGAYFDFADQAQGQVKVVQFRIKNNSPTKTATTITVTDDALSTASPTLASQTAFSTDGSNFNSTVVVASLAPGALSGILHVRLALQVSAQLGPWRQRLKATATTWS